MPLSAHNAHGRVPSAPAWTAGRADLTFHTNAIRMPHRCGIITAEDDRLLITQALPNNLKVKEDNMQIKQHYRLPAPGGPYRVGICTRQYSYVLGDGAVRKILCTIFYPSDGNAACKTHPYGGIPDHAQHIQTNTYEDLPVAAGCFPFIVFSHGMGLCAETHTILLEELASHGYVILGVNHQAAPPDEKNTQRDYATTQAFYALPEYGQWAACHADITDIAQHRRRYRSVVEAAPQTVKANRLWRQDCHVAADGLLSESSHSGSLFFQHIDPLKLAAAGMSFGGACAMGMVQECAKYQAVVNLDGVFYSETWDTPLPVPALLINGDSPVSKDHLRFPFLNAQRDAYHIRLTGCEHMNFTDWGNILAENPVIREYDGTQEVESKTLGSSDPEALTHTINSLVLDFLNKYVKGMAAPMLDGAHIPLAKVSRK